MTYSRFEPIDKTHDMGMFQALKHSELIKNHLFIAFHILLQDDFDGDLADMAVGFANNAICSGPEGAAKPVFRPG